MTSMDSLVVFNKLSVRNIQIESSKVKAEYFIEKKDGSSASNHLIYSYDSKIFNKNNPADINLASIMLVQVAINYGLFCETIELEGFFDVIDQRFIIDMIENTSREILVNKFLCKNEFLKPPFDQLEAKQKQKYTAAKIIFPNTDYQKTDAQTDSELFDNSQYVILSSGGKDSLLTYGIIKEIGTAHPVFINESGRHWFTAVNSYKYYQKNEPNTVKPWCNSDRIFNWMLRQMPFIKENFANIRADIYPIRLWTVAVFVFGALPIALKRRAGNIIVGNEYDTTVKSNHGGITHYNALYDQSRYFDKALTRYYQKKGWRINQFSLLRSLSELLIIKILTKRYPQLQEHQVSCHAAHESGGRMLPCGNCEKCRRIIGMLKALDESPERCGYTYEQITKGLNALEKKSVKQIGTDASHLYYLLMQKGFINTNEHTKRLAKSHSEITKLRFDSERSRPDDLPVYVRKPLFEILMTYAEGAVIRKDRKWQNIELNDNFLYQNER